MNNFVLNSIEKKVILILVDILIISSSLNLYFNYALDDNILSGISSFPFFITGVVLYFVIAYVLDFYNLEKAHKMHSIITQSGYIVGLFVLIILLGTVLFFDASFWRIPLFYFLFLTPVTIFLWRLFFKNIFKFIPFVKNVSYIYDESKVEKVEDDLITINGVYGSVTTNYKVRFKFKLGDSIFSEKNGINRSLNKIDSFILNIDSYNNIPADLESTLLNFIEKGKEVISYTSFYESVYEALPIQSHNDSFYEILQLKNKRIRYFSQFFHFFIDFILVLFIGLIFLLLLPFVLFFNFLFNRGPLFYSQKRVGKHGREFIIYKFRSMVVDAEKSGAQMAQFNDTRITPFGRILRKTRIDELPQILSVVKGDMSFIGPRPERKVFTDQLNNIIPFYNARHLVKPGITGWAQVKYKYGENLDDSIKKLEYDLYYIKNKSITLDIRIIFKTVTTVLFSRGH